MKDYGFIIPCEANHYCCFNEDLEGNPLVLFHLTLKVNFESITANGFKLGSHNSTIPSISYAKNSSLSLSHLKRHAPEECMIFVVMFDTLDQEGIVENQPDINVLYDNIQPTIMGYCSIPKEYKFVP